jgi:CRP/FNR family transcriptional regulator, cyclic AMP receptor protein
MATGQEITDVLSSLSLFADLTRPQLEVVAHSFEEQFFNPGQRILRQGFQGSNFFVIIDGEASVRIDGVERSTLARGDFFGEISVLLGETPSADVLALSPLRCLALPGPDLTEFLVAYPRVMYRMLKTEAHRLRAAVQWQG